MNMRKSSLSKWKILTVFSAVLFAFALFFIHAQFEVKIFDQFAFAAGSEGGGCNNCGGGGGSSGGGDGGGGDHGGYTTTTDRCPNLPGVQTTVPAGYVKVNGKCVQDQCPNIDGVQETVPVGKVKDANSNCVVDQCPNIDGIQTTVPDGKVKDENGNCVIDHCPNIDGIQSTIPAGYVKDSYGKCIEIPQCVPASISSSSSAEGQVGVLFSYTITATGTSPIAYTATNLPAGLTLSGNKITGTPTASGTFTVHINAENSCKKAYIALTIVIKEKACVTGGVTGSVDGANATLVVPANGCPVKVSFSSYSHTGTVKPYENQVFLDNITNIYGPGTHKIGPLKLSCNWQTDLYYGEVLKQLSKTGHSPDRVLIAYDHVEHQVCTVCVAPKVASALSATGKVGEPFSYTVAFEGTDPVTVDFDDLPPGLTASGKVISGTPTKAGTYKVKLTLDNKCGGVCTEITITITKDVCPNIPGDQATIPSGYAKDASGNCVTDQCPNIDGIQTEVPAGKVKDANGNCVVDQCPNIDGIQTSIPAGKVKDQYGNCVVDQCPNIDGVQTSIPTGYVKNSAGNCVVDQCPNLDGVQESLPSGYVKDSAGKCVIDQCPNLDGIQETVPSPYIKNSVGKCVIDQCPNIADIQETVPSGYVKNDEGKCVIDQCPNLDGIQETIPSPYVKDSAGKCVIDQCPNLGGIQTTIPDGYTKDSSGQCVQIPQCIPPKLTSPVITSGKVGVPFSYTVTISGTAPISVKLEDLPPGLTSNGATISGTPTKAGTYKVKVTLDNTCGGVCTEITITITKDVCPNIPGDQATIPPGMQKDVSGNCVEVPQCIPIVLNVPASVSGEVGQPFSLDIGTGIATGTQPIVVTATALPPGLTLSGTVISGTPTAPGTSTISVTCKNSCSEKKVDIVIILKVPQCPVPPPVITSGNASGVVGQPFNYQITATGTVDTATITSNLPAGLTFNQATRTISGTPTTAGTTTISVGVSNTCGSDTKQIVITVTEAQCTLPAPVITSSGNASGTVGTPFSYHIETSGTVGIVTVTGNLPAGLTYDSVTRTISGTPTAAGTVTVSLGASNSCGGVSKELVITITGGACTATPPSIGSGNSSTVTAGQQYSYTIVTTGNITGLTVENLPSWLHYDSLAKVVFGTAPSAGTYSFLVKAANGCAVAQTEVVVTVVGAPVCTGNCGGGGFFSPTVVLQKVGTSTPLAAFASVYLSQVPYTGVSDIVQSLSFLALLFAVSSLIAYVLVYRKPKYRFATAGVPVGVTTENERLSFTQFETENERSKRLLDARMHSFSESNVSPTVAAGIAWLKEPHVSAPASATSIRPQLTPAVKHAQTELPRQKPVSSIQNNVETEVSAPAVSVLETKSQMPAHVFSTRHLAERLEKAAKSKEVLLASDAADLIVLASDEKEENAAKILGQVITVAAQWYPAHEGSYLVLDAKKVRTILFSTYVSMVPLFIRWISEGKEDKALSFIRMLHAQGHAVSDFFKAVAFELDKVYRFRTERVHGADEYSIHSTFSWKKETLEKVVTAFVESFDGVYSSSYQAGKLALSKVMDIVKDEILPPAENLKIEMLA